MRHDLGEGVAALKQIFIKGCFLTRGNIPFCFTTKSTTCYREILPSPMSHERPKPIEAFGFTEREELWDRISHSRFETILKDKQTSIHAVQMESNNYGEFLFVTTSRPAGEGRSALTFFGLGYHEHRDRWMKDDWVWYETSIQGKNTTLDKDEALSVIEQRRAEVEAYAAGHHQSERGRLFETIADMTDDDGALAEFEDLDEWLDDGEY